MEFKSHIAPFLAFGALGLYAIWYAGRSFVAWRRDGSLGVRNRIRWMPLGAAAATVIGWAKGTDPTDDRRVHELQHPVVIVVWLIVCLAFAATTLFAAYDFLRFGHSF